MKSFKLAGILLCIALISEHSQAVLNKSTNKNVNNENTESDKKSDKNAEDRISSDYGVPSGPSFNGPAPVYGPPELTGNHAPVQIFPPPPAELPPPPPQVSHLPGPRPVSSYGPPRGPPQLQFPPRPVKLAPWKLSPPSPRFPQKPSGRGPPIPISLEAYGPPVNVPVSSFSLPPPNYGPPQPLAQPPIPQHPPPGVPAPPTPPDIKYDGWQPITGHVETPNANIHTPPSVNLDHSANVNLPSNSYGEPINNPEDHSLRQSIGHSDQGLPPPLLPDAEPLHNIQEAAESLPGHLNPSESLSATNTLVSSFNTDLSSSFEFGHASNSHSQDLSLQLPLQGSSSDFHGGLSNPLSDSYGPPSSGSISDSYGPPSSGSISDSYGPPSSGSISDSYGPPSSGSISDSYGPPSSGSISDSYGPPSSGSISDSYGPPSSGPPPRPISGIYGAPSPSFSHGSHSHNFGSSSSFSSSFTTGFRQQHRHPQSSFFQSHSFRNHGPRNPVSPSLIPPRSRAPTKFRESVPPSLFNQINHYLPPTAGHQTGPIKPATIYGPARGSGFNLQQQPPTFTKPISFHASQAGATSFAGASSIGSPLAAPNVNYGTPLSFTGFNTPAPVLTYGAPNFGPASSFISTTSDQGNLYNQHASISTAYGTPLPAPQIFNGQHDCTQQKSIETPIQLTSFRQSQGSLDSSSIPDYPLPAINELALEPSPDIQHEIKDSYGNPTGGAYDQRSASSSSVISNYNIDNSEAIVNGASAEALTAALTAQGYSQTSNSYNDLHQSDNHEASNSVSTNSLNVDQLTQLHGDSEPALALAQTLSAEGASDGFQIQGSKGTYVMQIQSANGLHQNSDGTIRHDQLLSDGLLQDILAAIEQPGDGGRNQLVEIQGSPQAQQLSEIHQQGYPIEDHDDLTHAAATNIASAVGNAKSEETGNSGDVALFFNNNYSDEPSKEIRSTDKSEGNVGELKKVSEEKTTEKST